MSELSSKVQKKLKDMPEFVEVALAASTEELKQIVLRSEQHIVDTENSVKDDQKLNATKELLKELKAPYRETLDALNTKIKYAVHLLEERGQKVE